MRRPGERRLEAAAYLVFALRAGLEALQAALDAKLDALVVAGLVVQAVELRGRTPVAAEQRRLADEEYRRGDHAAPMEGQFHHQRLGQGARRVAEEGACQIGLVVVAQEGLAVQGVDAIEQCFIELAAEARLEAHPGLLHAAALAVRLLALLRGEAGEVILEAAVAAVDRK